MKHRPSVLCNTHKGSFQNVSLNALILKFCLQYVILFKAEIPSKSYSEISFLPVIKLSQQCQRIPFFYGNIFFKGEGGEYWNCNIVDISTSSITVCVHTCKLFDHIKCIGPMLSKQKVIITLTNKYSF